MSAPILLLVSMFYCTLGLCSKGRVRGYNHGKMLVRWLDLKVTLASEVGTLHVVNTGILHRQIKEQDFEQLLPQTKDS